MANKKIAKKDDAALAAENLYGNMANAGFENMGRDDLALPFINVLQTNSPQVDPDDGIEGAKAGMFYNTVTQSLHADVIFIPLGIEKSFIEWQPRDQGGGGFVQQHDFDSPEVREAIQANGGSMGKIPFGSNELVETRTIYALLLEEDAETVIGPAVINFTSTKITPMKKMISALRMIKGQPPIFANRVSMSTVKKEKDGNKYFTVAFEPAVGTTYVESLIHPEDMKDLLLDAADNFKLFKEGSMKADHAKSDGEVPEGTVEGDGSTPF